MALEQARGDSINCKELPPTDNWRHDDNCTFTGSRPSRVVRIDDDRHQGRRSVLRQGGRLDVRAIRRLAQPLHAVQAQWRRGGRRPDAAARRHEHAALLVDVCERSEARGRGGGPQTPRRQRAVASHRGAHRRAYADAEGPARRRFLRHPARPPTWRQKWAKCHGSS